MHLGAFLNAHRGKSPPIDIVKMVPLIIDRKQVKTELMTAEEYEKTKELFSKIKWQAQN